MEGKEESLSFNQPKPRTPGIIYLLVELMACHDAAAQILAILVSFVSTSLMFLSTGMAGNGMLYLNVIGKTVISVLMTPSYFVLSRIMTL